MRSRDVEYEIQLEYDGIIEMDGERFRRVIYNITGNAAEAMDSGGKLILKVLKEDNNVIFLFIDNGPGIPEEHQDKIFQPFYTVGKEKGTGLGMAIAKRIVEEHGGSISFDSVEGKGTTFKVVLPL